MICGSGEQPGLISRPPLDAVSPPLLPADRMLLTLALFAPIWLDGHVFCRSDVREFAYHIYLLRYIFREEMLFTYVCCLCIFQDLQSDEDSFFSPRREKMRQHGSLRRCLVDLHMIRKE